MMFITFYFELHKALGCSNDSFVFLLVLKLSIFHFVVMARISFTTFTNYFQVPCIVVF